ncbi:MAG: hypothetical protein JEY99_18150 [Spirochaetales bacterium]|nr:hypothetical protein [Spirochaetales bacterium]
MRHDFNGNWPVVLWHQGENGFIWISDACAQFAPQVAICVQEDSNLTHFRRLEFAVCLLA